MPEFTNHSIVELSVFRGVSACVCYNAIKYGCMPISVFLLLKVPHVSASTAEDMDCFALRLDGTSSFGVRFYWVW